MSDRDGEIGPLGRFIDNANKSRWFPLVVAGGLLFSFAYGLRAMICQWPNFQEATKPTQEKVLSYAGQMKAIILIVWIVVPPIWFFGEYYGIEKKRAQKYKEITEPVKFKWEHFKYGQDVMSKLWLATVTALTILYFGKDLKP